MTVPVHARQNDADSHYAGEDDDLACAQCRPFPCDNPDVHLAHEVPSRFTPLKNRGCHCGADFDGRDCMCFEDY